MRIRRLKITFKIWWSAEDDQPSQSYLSLKFLCILFTSIFIQLPIRLCCYYWWRRRWVLLYSIQPCRAEIVHWNSSLFEFKLRTNSSWNIRKQQCKQWWLYCCWRHYFSWSFTKYYRRFCNASENTIDGRNRNIKCRIWRINCRSKLWCLHSTKAPKAPVDFTIASKWRWTNCANNQRAN